MFDRFLGERRASKVRMENDAGSVDYSAQRVIKRSPQLALNSFWNSFYCDLNCDFIEAAGRDLTT